MRDHLARADVEPSSRMYMAYALGHALERAGDFAGSFEAYREGARLFRRSFVDRGQAHDEEAFLERIRGIKRVYHAADPRQAAAPRRTVRRRSSSSACRAPARRLVEQILSSHSQVEGTRELPLIADIMKDLAFSRLLVTPERLSRSGAGAVAGRAGGPGRALPRRSGRLPPHRPARSSSTSGRGTGWRSA